MARRRPWVSSGPKPPPDYISTITRGEETFTVHTEDGGRKIGKIVSRVRARETTVFLKEADYSLIVHLPDFPSRRSALMEQLHQSTVEDFRLGAGPRPKSKADYLDHAHFFLKTGWAGIALSILKEGVETFPYDPFLLSHYGLMMAETGKNADEGIQICRQAIRDLERHNPLGAAYFSPAFFLNLGRTCLAAGNRADAYQAFASGLEAAPDDYELLWEMRKLGHRRKPKFPSLGRNHPINKYFGLMSSVRIRRPRRTHRTPA